MAFCNSCGAPLADGTGFCSKCGEGRTSALKIILVLVGVIVLLGILGVATIGFVGYRIAKSAKVSQKGDNVKVETPFGSVETSNDPQKVADELRLEIYPGAEVQKAGTVSLTLGSLYSVTANFESNDSVDKVCDFYRSKFPGANVASSDQNQCTIISGGSGNQTSISVQPSGKGTRFTIVKVSKNKS